MSSDGAALGVSAERALKTILGGEPAPTEAEQESVEAMRTRLLAMTPDQAVDYGSTADYAASLILKFLLEDPERAKIPSENVYEHDADGSLVFNAEGGLNLLEPGLYEVMKEFEGYDLGPLGLSGFMWGWAVNAARRCVELPAVPNPAIVTIGPE